MEYLYYNGQKYLAETYKVETYDDNILQKTDYRLFGGGYTHPRIEATAWGGNQVFWLKKVENYKKPTVKIYDENNNIIFAETAIMNI